jgi:hypothetical protein
MITEIHIIMHPFPVCPAACLDTKHAGIGLALHHAVVACVAGFAGPVFVGALLQRTGSFASVSAWRRGTVRVGDMDGGKDRHQCCYCLESSTWPGWKTWGYVL